MNKPHVLSGGRYPVLRALAIMYVIGAVLTVIGTIVGIGYIYARATGTFLDRTIMAIAALAGAFFVIVSMLAIAEVLKLFIDIEHNSRMAAPGQVGMPLSVTPNIASTDGGRLGSLATLNEETAEAALLRGH